MIDLQWLKRLHHLSRAAGRAGGVSLVAPCREDLSGGAGAPVGLRDYAPGDDYRQIDWVRCARHDELLSKTLRPVEDLHVYILLDCSPSMGLGNPAKFDLARQVAAALGYAALADLARLSVAAFCDRIVAQLPPIRHETRIFKLLRFLRQLPLQGTRTDLKRAAEGFVGRYQRHGPVVVISDLYDSSGFQPGLDCLRRRGYEPRLVQIHAPCEAQPDLLGDVELRDVETQAARPVTVTERALRRYQGLFAEFQQSVRSYSARHGLACVQIATDAPGHEVLLKVLGGGGRGWRRGLSGQGHPDRV
jgi:uncharacterized protein (DUF58 family)